MRTQKNNKSSNFAQKNGVNPLPSLYSTLSNRSDFFLRSEPSVYYNGMQNASQNINSSSTINSNMNSINPSGLNNSGITNMNGSVLEGSSGPYNSSVNAGYVSSPLSTSGYNSGYNAQNNVTNYEPSFNASYIQPYNSSFGYDMNSSMANPSTPVPLPPGTPKSSFHRNFVQQNSNEDNDDVSYTNGNLTRPSTAFQSTGKRSSLDVYPNRINSAKAFRPNNLNGNTFNQNGIQSGPYENSLEDTIPQTIVPPNLSQSLSSVEIERLADIIRMSNNTIPKSAKMQAHPQSARSKNTKSETISLNFSNLLKTTKKKKKKKTFKSTQTVEDFESTNEILLRQNAELERRLMHAENEGMIWKARFHSFKNESDTLIAQLQKLNIGFKARIKQIQEKNASLDSLQKEHERQIDLLNDTHRSKIIMAQQSHKITLNNLRKDYEEKLKVLEERLNQALKKSQEDIDKSYQYTESLKAEHAKEINRIQAEREIEIEKLNINNYKQDKEIQELNSKFKEQLDALHQKYQESAEVERTNHKNILEEHFKSNAEEQNKLHTEYEFKLQEFKNTHEAIVSELKKSYETELMELKYKYDDQIQSQKKEHDALFASLKLDHETQILSLKKSYEKAIDELKQNNLKEIENQSEAASGINDYSNVVQDLMDVTERKVLEYQTYIKDLENLFSQAERKALVNISLDKDSTDNYTIKNIESNTDSNTIDLNNNQIELTNENDKTTELDKKLAKYKNKHNHLINELNELRNEFPDLNERIELSLLERINELENSAMVTLRVIEDLQSFSTNQTNAAKESTFTTLSSLYSQYDDNLFAFEIHINILKTKSAKWRITAKTELLVSKVYENNTMQNKSLNISFDNKSIDSKSEKSIRMVDTPTSFFSNSSFNISQLSLDNKINNTLTLDTATILQSIVDFKMVDPLENTGIDIDTLNSIADTDINEETNFDSIDKLNIHV